MPSTKPPIYDRIGSGYTGTRRPDPRIAAAIGAALGDARTLVNVGAGAGAYEPPVRRVVAVEPSRAMIRQRPTGAAPCIQAVAERLPFRDGAVDASLAILTIHHWTEQAAGLAELRRVARRRVVVFTWDLGSLGEFWLTTEYFPEILDLDRPRFASMAVLEQRLGAIRTIPVPIPHDCQDGFLGAFWRRPEAYLDPAVRSARARPARHRAPDRGPQDRALGGAPRRLAGAREPRSRVPAGRRRARLAEGSRRSPSGLRGVAGRGHGTGGLLGVHRQRSRGPGS
jgi:SAM-dependent methyltransferase